jgi:hypothetical protein
MGTGVSFLWNKGPGREAYNSVHLVPRSKMVELYLHSPLGLHGVMQLIKHRDDFKFYMTYSQVAVLIVT